MQVPHWRAKRCSRSSAATRYVLTGLAVLTLCGSAAHAQTATPFAERELVNFSYSAIMGTGYYRVADRDIYVFRIPFSLNRRDAQVRDDGTRERGLRWIMPLTLGVYNFSPDLENGLPEPDDIGTVTVLPGIETTWLRPSGWRVRATAQLGAGLDMERDEWTTIVAAGLRGRYELRPMTADQAGISYGQGILWSRFDPDTGERDSLGLIALGMEARWLQSWGGQQTRPPKRLNK